MVTVARNVSEFWGVFLVISWHKLKFWESSTETTETAWMPTSIYASWPEKRVRLLIDGGPYGPDVFLSNDQPRVRS